jgi:hypothetical protein
MVGGCLSGVQACDVNTSKKGWRVVVVVVVVGGGGDGGRGGEGGMGIRMRGWGQEPSR